MNAWAVAETLAWRSQLLMPLHLVSRGFSSRDSGRARSDCYLVPKLVSGIVYQERNSRAVHREFDAGGYGLTRLHSPACATTPTLTVAVISSTTGYNRSLRPVGDGQTPGHWFAGVVWLSPPEKKPEDPTAQNGIVLQLPSAPYTFTLERDGDCVLREWHAVYSGTFAPVAYLQTLS
jgi:hypothetical protein